MLKYTKRYRMEPYSKKLAAMSKPELVRTVRKLLKDNAAWKLTRMGEESSITEHLHAAIDETRKRRISIKHPELL